MPSAVNGTNGVVGGGTAGVASSALRSSKVSTDQFLRLLVTQLQNQDPLNPLSNEDFLTQLAQFQSLEETMETAANTKSLLLSQQLAAASNLIGKSVVAVLDNEQIAGKVDKVVVVDGRVKLVVGGLQVDMSEITEVTAAATSAAEGQ